MEVLRNISKPEGMNKLIHELNSQNRVFGLDIMRAIAILLVILAHSNWMLTNHISHIKWIDIGGFLGVEMFFVLSGFLIGNIIIKSFNESGTYNFNNATKFWYRRWFRTLPNYFLILLLNILLYSALNKDFPLKFIEYFFFLQNLYKPHPYFFMESWSLVIEEWFYLLLPLFLIFFNIFSIEKLHKRHIFMGVIILFIVLPNIARIIIAPHIENDVISWDNYVRKIALLRMDSIMYGVIFAWFSNYYMKVFSAIANKLFCLGVILLTINLFITFSYDVSWYHKTFYFTLYSISFALFLPKLYSIKYYKTILGKVLTFLSIISYSMYLIHFSLLLVIIKMVFDQGTFVKSIFAYIAYWTITIVLSSMLYTVYEKPTTDLRNKLLINHAKS